MNKRIYIAGVVIALTGIVAIWMITPNTPAAVAAIDPSHASHDHELEKQDEPLQKEHVDNLFEAEDHAGHGHTEEVAVESEDDHAGHGHENQGSEAGICPEHRIPEAEDALCQGGSVAGLRPGEGMKVRLASLDVAAKAGVRVVKPQKVSHAEGIDIPGRVEFNRNKLARITPLSAGIILKVAVQPGSSVKKGDLLAEIAMPEIATIKAQFLAAGARQKETEATYQREKNLLARGISSVQEFQLADSEYRSAQSASEQYRQQLLNYGLAPESIQQLLLDGQSTAALPLRAPFDGTIMAVETALGEAVAPGTPLFTLANLDSLWIELSIPESRIYQIRVNAPIQASFDGLPGMAFSGRVFQTGAVVDERTRSLKVLAEVENPDHRLKVGMFGNVQMLESSKEQVLTVPADVLQNIDGKSYVFIQQEPDLFDLRRVQTGAKADGKVIILAGLSPDDQMVVGQGFALKSEVLKARLGASCADH